MADKYRNFAELASHEQAGVDYRIAARRIRPRFAIVAPHGGGIEQGTSELADAAGGLVHSCYTFEGLKTSGNRDLHITSTRFDEPLCLTVIGTSQIVVTLHGEESTEDGEGVFMGGLDAAVRDCIGAVLRREGFDVRTHPDPDLQGRDPANVCNRGLSGAGVQLELSRAVRQTMFESLTREGRTRRTARFDVFVKALQEALAGDCM
jgi:phage replication-related protein YjqB (UPF0714/DUF867 family)